MTSTIKSVLGEGNKTFFKQNNPVRGGIGFFYSKKSMINTSKMTLREIGIAYIIYLHGRADYETLSDIYGASTSEVNRTIMKMSDKRFALFSTDDFELRNHLGLNIIQMSLLSVISRAEMATGSFCYLDVHVMAQLLSTTNDVIEGMLKMFVEVGFITRSFDKFEKIKLSEDLTKHIKNFKQ